MWCAAAAFIFDFPFIYLFARVTQLLRQGVYCCSSHGRTTAAACLRTCKESLETI
jgi:hypothetical protein